MKRLLPLLSLLFLACQGGGDPGFEAWSGNWMMPLDKTETAPSIASRLIELRVTPGEYEPAVVVLRSGVAARIRVNLEPSRGKGKFALDPAWCEISSVESLADSTHPNRLFPLSGPLSLTPDTTRFLWLTIRPPEGTEPGNYSGRLLLESDGGRIALTLDCTVLPFKLEDSPVVNGAFMWLVDLPPGWYRDMKEHGFDAFQCFTWEWAVRDMEHDRSSWRWDPEPIKVKSRGDSLVLDFSVWDDIMAQVNEAGMKGPVVISLGNDRFMHFETRIAQVFGLPLDTTLIHERWNIISIGPPMSARLDTLVSQGLRQLRRHWDEMGWPQELQILVYDEPTHGLLERGKQRYDMIKRVIPGTRVYGVVMDKRELAEQVAPLCDILVVNGDFDGCREVALNQGKDFYVYGGMGTANRSRFLMGWLPWRARAGASFFWMYNYWFYDPDRCAVYIDPRDPNRLIRSVEWECLREGADDLRYAATAEKMIGAAASEKRAAALARLEELRASVDPFYRAAPPKELEDPAARAAYFLEPQRVRDALVRIILDLQ